VIIESVFRKLVCGSLAEDVLVLLINGWQSVSKQVYIVGIIFKQTFVLQYAVYFVQRGSEELVFSSLYIKIESIS
jgi:hypothetical protein